MVRYRVVMEQVEESKWRYEIFSRKPGQKEVWEVCGNLRTYAAADLAVKSWLLRAGIPVQ